MVKKSVGNLVETVATWFVAMTMYISRTIVKWFQREISGKTSLERACVGIGHGILSEVAEVVLTLVAESTAFN